MPKVKRFKVITTKHVTIEYDSEDSVPPHDAGVSDPTPGPSFTTPTAPPSVSENQPVNSVGISETPLDRGLKAAERFYQKLVKTSTQSKYDGAYKIWEEFCAKSNIPTMPGNPEHVSACLALNMMEHESLSRVEMLRAAIAHRHRANCLPSPTEHFRIVNLFKAFNREYGSPRNPVDPIGYNIIQKVFDNIYQFRHGPDGQHASLVLWRTTWRIVINFFSLGRFGDMDNVQRSDLVFGTRPSLHLKIGFSNLKNDPFSEGGEKLISANLDLEQYCPVRLTQNYLRYLGSSFSGNMQPACQSKNPNSPLPGSKVCYSNALSDLRQLLNALGFGQLRFGEHSPRRGGASHAANLGMPMEDLQRLGGWKSQMIPAKYVDLSTARRIAVSKVLQRNI